MASIKSFSYLDQYKMYSISSQIFEGLTEYVIGYSFEEREETEMQKGPYLSGKILGDIISKGAGTEERKFLHDYSYTLFEKKLIEDQKVIIIDHKSTREQLRKISEYSFIKISGKAIFNDVELMIQTIKSFNAFGEALTYITNHETIQQQAVYLEENIKEIKDRNKRSIERKKGKEVFDVKKLATSIGLRLDPALLENLAFVLEYGYKDQFEVQIPIDIKIEDTEQVIFSSILKRELLRDKEDILIKKYARNSEKNFTIFGIIAQSEREVLTTDNIESVEEKQNFKQALMELNTKLSGLEDMYIGRLPNEVVIDPIALYREM